MHDTCAVLTARALALQVLRVQAYKPASSLVAHKLSFATCNLQLARLQVLQARRGLWQFNVKKITIITSLTYVATQPSYD